MPHIRRSHLIGAAALAAVVASSAIVIAGEASTRFYPVAVAFGIALGALLLLLHGFRITRGARLGGAVLARLPGRGDDRPSIVGTAWGVLPVLTTLMDGDRALSASVVGVELVILAAELHEWLTPVQLRERGIDQIGLIPWERVTGWSWARWTDRDALFVHVRRAAGAPDRTLALRVPAPQRADVEHIFRAYAPQASTSSAA